MKKFNKFSITILVGAIGLVGPIIALAAGPATINLGTAGNYVILAKSGITTTGATAIVFSRSLFRSVFSLVHGAPTFP